MSHLASQQYHTIPKRSFPPPLQRALDTWNGQETSLLAMVSFVEGMICFAHIGTNIRKIRYTAGGKSVHPKFARFFRCITAQGCHACVSLHWLPLHTSEQLLCLSQGICLPIQIGSAVCKKITLPLVTRLFPAPKKWLARLLAVARKLPVARQFAHGWILADRDWKADDNAEHFYRWIRHNYPYKKIWFALSPASPDWLRLRQEGFNLIPLTGWRWLLALLRAEWVISSNMMGYLTQMPLRLQLGPAVHSRFCFLQHGVIKDYLPSVNRFHVDMFVTSAHDEYSSIAKNSRNPYVYSRRETVLCGLPRHDVLLAAASRMTPQTILFMPTWRFFLAAAFCKNSSKRQYNPEFIHSEFYSRWRELFQSEHITKAATAAGYTIRFCLHPYLEQQRPDFTFAGQSLVSQNQCMAEILANAALLVTDYSSVAMDTAFLQRPVVYYQFDRKAFRRQHTYRKGYFDYDLHGFGPVAQQHATAEYHIIDAISRRYSPVEPYATRAQRFFTWNDGNNSQRLFDALTARTLAK